VSSPTASVADGGGDHPRRSRVKQARGRGLGSALLDAVDDELARRGIADLRIAVMVGYDDALRLYERRGLRRGEIVLYRLSSFA
jgi:ribosomal protein S18 acetylase RimI-like enzyme